MNPESQKYSDNLSRARKMRHFATPDEDQLWNMLRGRQVDGIKFRRQHRIDPYVVDFYCAEWRLVVEVDGTSHTHEAQIQADHARTRYLEEKGLRVVRFPNDSLRIDPAGVISMIRSALASAKVAALPTPLPLPRAGEGRGEGTPG